MKLKKFTNQLIFIVDGIDESIRLQTKLFRFGFRWHSTDAIEPKYTNKPFIYIYNDLKIAFGGNIQRAFGQNKEGYSQVITCSLFLELNRIELEYLGFIFEQSDSEIFKKLLIDI